MPKIPVYDKTGKQIEEIELSDAIFGIEPNTAVMHLAVKSYLTNHRQGTQSTLTRSEVSGGGRKPWRQKGTGRARQGSIRAPQWIHGGIALGPKPRDYSFNLNKKVRRLAIRSALSAKFAEGAIVVVDSLNVAEPKTKPFAAFLKAVNVDGSALIATAAANENVKLSARNIEGVKLTTAAVLNTYELLKYGKLVVDKEAIAKIEEVFA
ncbi:MAG: 50S ribosomal protein L4 [Clostridia bacterium]|nr:50S ribosomal protein L4 [Clostridia bacterium]